MAAGQDILDGVVAEVGEKTSPGRPPPRRSGSRSRADGLDGPVGQDLLDGVVAGVGDVDIACGVECHAERPAEPGADGPDAPPTWISLTALWP